MTSSTPQKLPVYPSQLDSLKQYANYFCHWVLRKYRTEHRPSSFKRNDALSRALGYKSHSDLVQHSKSLVEPKDAACFSHKDIDLNIAAKEFSHCFNLTPKQIYDVLANPYPKQTEFEVINGCPVLQNSPLDPDISNEQREQSELDAWWNIPYIEENYDTNTQTIKGYDVRCLDGNCWDRPTGKAWNLSLEDALVFVEELKASNGHYRDYAEEPPLFAIQIEDQESETQAFHSIIGKLTEHVMLSRGVHEVNAAIVELEHSESYMQSLSNKLMNLSVDGAQLGLNRSAPCFHHVNKSGAEILIEFSDQIIPYLKNAASQKAHPTETASYLPISFDAFFNIYEDAMNLKEITQVVTFLSSDNVLCVESFLMSGTRYKKEG